MEVGTQVIKFNVYEAMKHPFEDYSLLGLNAIDVLIEEVVEEHALALCNLDMNDNMLDNEICAVDYCAFSFDFDSALSLNIEDDMSSDSSISVSRGFEFEFDNSDCTSISSFSSYTPCGKEELHVFAGSNEEIVDLKEAKITMERAQEFELSKEEIEALCLQGRKVSLEEDNGRLHNLRERLHASGRVSQLGHPIPEMVSEGISLNSPLVNSHFCANLDVQKLVPSIDQPPTLELKPLPSNLKYAYLRENEKLPVIIADTLTPCEEEKLLGVLRKYERAIGWTLADIPGLSPSLCTHRILLNEGAKSVRQPQRRLNPLILEVVKKEITKLLSAGIIYPISDSEWVSPIHVVPKKSGITVVKSENGELVPTRVQNSWRVCIDYRRLNDATRKDHFPLPFIDQMLERLASKTHYCFLDGFSGYFQVPIAPEDQEKTTFTCPFGTFAYRRMPFGLCNAPGTFQRCMMSIFSDLLESGIEVFMDDFSLYGNSFDSCLSNLEKALSRCVEKNLVLNFEKCHFMVEKGIVLGHLVSKNGIEVDRAKVEVISSLPYPTNVKELRSFLGHVGFYRRFIKDFSKIASPLSHLLQKDIQFDFNEKCQHAFTCLKDKLIAPPILVAPTWGIPFELSCDASNMALGVMLGQHDGRLPRVIAYASKTLDKAQINYTTTEKEMFAVVFGLDKFRQYLLHSKVIIFTDHAAVKYLLTKPQTKPRLIRWVMLVQEFEIEVRDRPGCENHVADHLSRLPPMVRGVDDASIVCDEFRDVSLCALNVEKDPWYAHIVNYLCTGIVSPSLTYHQVQKLKRESNYYVWDDPHLWRLCNDSILRKCISDREVESVLSFCHAIPCGGHFSAKKTSRKVLEAGFYWPTLFKDAYDFCKSCSRCQMFGSLGKRHEMPQTPMLFCEIFDVWGIDFMGPFPTSNGFSYILLAVDYLSRWVEAIPTRTNDALTVTKFLRSYIFCRYGVPKALVSDQGTHFCNKIMANLLAKFGVTHKVSTAYHPQTNGEAEVSNRQVKRILERIVKPSRKDWSTRLEEALWAYRTAYKTPIGMSPFRLIYGKACHLPVEVEHRSYWAIKECNFNMDKAASERQLQLNELEELRMEAYESSRIFKERTKALHDQNILRKEFKEGDRVLRFRAKFAFGGGKLKEKWKGPYLVIKAHNFGMIEIQDEKSGQVYKVNGHMLKHYKEPP